MDGPRFSFESMGHFADIGLSHINAYQRNLMALPDAQMDNALVELFTGGPNAHLTTDDLAAELAAEAPPHNLPPVVDFGMFQAAQQDRLLRAESSSLPERHRPIPAVQPVTQPSESKPAKPLLLCQEPAVTVICQQPACVFTSTSTDSKAPRRPAACSLGQALFSLQHTSPSLRLLSGQSSSFQSL